MIDFAAFADSDSRAGRTTIICRVVFGGLEGDSGCVMYVMCGDLYVVASSPAIKNKSSRVLAALPKRLQWHSQPPTNPFPDRNRPRQEANGF